MASFAERMMGAARLDTATYEEVEADRTATPQALGVVVIAAVAGGVGGWGAMGFRGFILGLVTALLGWVVWAAIIWLVGTKILPEPTTSADVGELLRTLGFAQSPGVFRILGFVPFLSLLINIVVTIWILVATVVAVRQALDYRSTGRAIGVCVLGFIAYLVIAFALTIALGGAAALGSVAAGA